MNFHAIEVTARMPHVEQPGLVVRQKSPLNLEFQFSTLADWLTPIDQYYVRSHFASPELHDTGWRLKIGGAVDKPFSLSPADLAALPQTSFPAVMECAGNGRVFYEPAREGLQWQSGAVGNAEWGGVLLRDVLELAGVKPGAVDVILVGADRGIVDGGKKTASPGPISFARSLPLAKALSEDVLLATAMNGETLTTEHGYPLRAVVGGWFGMAWVKWITEIRVVERPFLGYWQARDYFRWERDLGEPVLVPLSRMEVKAQMARPVNGAVVRVGEPVRIFGAAWGGEDGIEAVEICAGDGLGWRPATLLQPESRFGWRLFEHLWTPLEPGRFTLRCRACDTAGRTQPEAQHQDCESYVANWIVPIEVRAVTGNRDVSDDFVI
ncbi:MAG TPA: sulfite oxidase [Lichenihabitans sp.]|nr:sulfite oxidase [Lichenihabitans sp.]